MNRFWAFFFLAASCCGIVRAQEHTYSLIITENGDAIKAYNVEIGPTSVFYTVTADADSETRKIRLSDVMVIKNEKGEKWVPGKEQATSNSPGKAADSPENPYRDDNANNAALDAADPDHVRFIDKPEDKPASEVILLYRPTQESVLADKNIAYRVVTHVPENGFEKHKFQSLSVDIVITNRSNSTVYIDLGNTFFICNGEGLRYYTPSAVTNTTSTTTGASVNMGAVAGALGVGGGLGQLASGINVGGAHTNIRSTTVFAERVLSIPPGSTKAIQGAEFSDYGKTKETGLPVGEHGIYENLTLLLPADDFYKIGQAVCDFDKQLFHNVAVFVTYGMTEDIAAPVQLRSAYVPAKMIAAKSGKCIDHQPIIINDACFSENYRNCLSLFLRLAKAKKK